MTVPKDIDIDDKSIHEFLSNKDDDLIWIFIHPAIDRMSRIVNGISYAIGSKVKIEQYPINQKEGS